VSEGGGSVFCVHLLLRPCQWRVWDISVLSCHLSLCLYGGCCGVETPPASPLMTSGSVLVVHHVFRMNAVEWLGVH
jgi:hypothetical protein